MTTAHTPLYIGDNGRIFCRDHGGATFQTTGRDLSGQRALRLRDADIAELATTVGHAVACESCRARISKVQP